MTILFPCHITSAPDCVAVKCNGNAQQGLNTKPHGTQARPVVRYESHADYEGKPYKTEGLTPEFIVVVATLGLSTTVARFTYVTLIVDTHAGFLVLKLNRHTFKMLCQYLLEMFDSMICKHLKSTSYGLWKL